MCQHKETHRIFVSKLPLPNKDQSIFVVKFFVSTPFGSCRSSGFLDRNLVWPQKAFAKINPNKQQPFAAASFVEWSLWATAAKAGGESSHTNERRAASAAAAQRRKRAEAQDCQTSKMTLLFLAKYI